MTDRAVAGPKTIFRLGKFRFSRYQARSWECSDGSLGSSGRTPLGAFVRQRRWVREYWRNPRKYVIPDD